MRRYGLFAGLLALVLVLAACGGASTPAAPESAPAEAPAQTPTEAPTEAPTAAPEAEAVAATVAVSEHPSLGPILVGPNGMTLYIFTRDEPGVSNCYDQCAENWPPLLVDEGQEPIAGEGVTGMLSVVERTDGGRQVAYNGMPLYYFVNDAQPGDVAGQGVRDVWFVVHPDAPTVAVSDQTVADGQVVVDRVVSFEPGWIVIHAAAEGRPGPVIGWAAVQPGENLDVAVQADQAGVTDTLFAMLHVDRGTLGTYEFPGADGPVRVGEQVVVKPFSVAAAAAESRKVRFTIVPEETTASYTIDEVFLNQNNRLNTAVGTTHEVEGYIVLNYDDPTASEFGQFVVDISTLTSDSDRRDRAIRERWLESAKYPLATFVVKEVKNFPADAQEGQEIAFQLVGDMTVKETTREVTWDVTAMLQGDRLTGKATTFILLEDFNVPPPSIGGILRVTDGMTLTLDFVMQATE
ncbi:MAG: hypothetical protein Kow0047_06470 [Anaerolineae bacterium]